MKTFGKLFAPALLAVSLISATACASRNSGYRYPYNNRYDHDRYDHDRYDRDGDRNRHHHDRDHRDDDRGRWR